VGSAKRDLDAMPEDVKDVFGHAIDLAQAGGKHPDAKVLTGFGSAGVLEVVEDDRGSTYRAVYTVKFAGWVYVLHCFQKKSKTGIRTPKEDMDLILARLKAAKTGFRSMAGPARSTSMTRSTAITIEEGSTNVYADLGYAEAAEMQRKSQLAAEIARAIKARRLTQQEAAELLGIDQSKISRITRGQFRGVSEAKLLELVTRLGHDVRIVVGPVRRRTGKIELEFA
jgi:phage-related protein/predicted XRE-type DNA-binding protein